MTERTSNCALPKKGKRCGRSRFPLGIVGDETASEVIGAHTKNPATLPTANIRAAHAFPAGCFGVGRTSTSSARSRAWTRPRSEWDVRGFAVLAGIDGKVYTINREDGEPDGEGVVLLWVGLVQGHGKGRLTEDEPRGVNTDANGLVKPRRRVANAHNAAQTTIKGRRLPKGDFELSARMPGLG